MPCAAPASSRNHSQEAVTAPAAKTPRVAAAWAVTAAPSTPTVSRTACGFSSVTAAVRRSTRPRDQAPVASSSSAGSARSDLTPR